MMRTHIHNLRSHLHVDHVKMAGDTYLGGTKSTVDLEIRRREMGSVRIRDRITPSHCFH